MASERRSLGEQGWSRGWPAPAKVNLFLHITGRRADGYHDLQTVFQFLSVADDLDFRVRADGHITRAAGASDIVAERDLAVRAAGLLQRATGTGQGVDIRIAKRIPIGGGLGGGSSDAATALVALNRLWRCGLDAARLQALALELGADVPIFVHGQAAWAEGRGERFQPLDLPEPWFVVIDPGIAVSTAEVFADAQLTRSHAPIKIANFISGEGVNVCEPVVRRRHASVGRALDWLGRFAPARLSGTGGCLFASFAERGEAQQVCERVPSPWRGIVARGSNRSLLWARGQDAKRAG